MLSNPSLLSAHRGRKAIRQGLLKFTSTQNRGALRESKLLSDPCAGSWSGDGMGMGCVKRAGINLQGESYSWRVGIQGLQVSHTHKQLTAVFLNGRAQMH